MLMVMSTSMMYAKLC